MKALWINTEPVIKLTLQLIYGIGTELTFGIISLFVIIATILCISRMK